MKPISSSITVASPLVCLCSPLLTGGHWVCLNRNFSDSASALARSLKGLVSVSPLWRPLYRITCHSLYSTMNDIFLLRECFRKLDLVIIQELLIGHHDQIGGDAQSIENRPGAWMIDQPILFRML